MLKKEHLVVARWILGPLFALLIWALPLDLNVNAHRLAGLSAWTVLWWILEPIPLPVTSLLATSLAVILGIADVKTAFAPFAHPLIFLFMGGFMLARSMGVHGLDRRIALTVLTRESISGQHTRLLTALLFLTAGLSLIVSNTAATAMLMPITLGIAVAVYPRQEEAQGLILTSVAYASSIGGIGSPVGSTPNIIARGMLENLAGIQLTFLDWVIYSFPTMIAALTALCFIKVKQLPKPNNASRTLGSVVLRKELKSMGKLKQGERNTLVALCVAIAIWLTPSVVAIVLGTEHSTSQLLKNSFPEAIGAILAACLLFLLPVKQGRPTLTWPEAVQIDWGSLLLFGGGLSLGTLLFKTGLASVIGTHLLDATGGSIVLLTILAVLFAIFFTETTSNTATANMLIPLVIAASKSSGVPTLVPTLGVAYACSMAFMMPISTPPNAIVYGTGKVPLSMMIKQGFIMNWVAAAIILLGTAYIALLT